MMNSSKTPFTPGDRVVLKSGGPDMTVAEVFQDLVLTGGSTRQDDDEDANKQVELAYEGETWVHCQWFHENELRAGVFGPALLKKSPADPGQ